MQKWEFTGGFLVTCFMKCPKGVNLWRQEVTLLRLGQGWEWFQVAVVFPCALMRMLENEIMVLCTVLCSLKTLNMPFRCVCFMLRWWVPPQSVVYKQLLVLSVAKQAFWPQFSFPVGAGVQAPPLHQASVSPRWRGLLCLQGWQRLFDLPSLYLFNFNPVLKEWRPECTIPET